jgi:hypothetical protein
MDDTILKREQSAQSFKRLSPWKTTLTAPVTSTGTTFDGLAGSNFLGVKKSDREP